MLLGAVATTRAATCASILALTTTTTTTHKNNTPKLVKLRKAKPIRSIRIRRRQTKTRAFYTTLCCILHILTIPVTHF
jgi:hypothetical protein